MPKVQPIYDTRERARAPRESAPIQNERPRGAAGILGEEEQHMLRRPTRSPRLRTICRVVAYARRNPARMNRRIISEFGRVAPKCSLICGKMRGGLPKQGDALRVRTPAATRDLRKDHEKAAERKERRHPHERQLGAGFFPSKRRLGPKVFHLGAEKERPSKGGATMSRKPRYASFAPALGPGEQVKSSSTCTSTPPFAVIGAPIAAKQPSTHAFNSSNCSPLLM